ncbi:MAG: hypothetical protein ABL961_05005 [Vicinamibacterales bacterium]
MTHRFHGVAGSIALIAGLCVLGSAARVAAQGQTAAKPYSPPRTPDGKPDLQGVWEHNAVTPLERPKALANKPVLSEQELANLKRNAARVLDAGDAQFGDDLFEAALAEQKGSKSYDPATGNYDQSWMVQRSWDNRTSLIVDPPDGRVPPFTPEALKRQKAERGSRVIATADSWEDRSLSERCITYGVNKLIRAGYNSYVQIFQTPGYAVVQMEMIHDARVIPLDGRPHVSKAIRGHLGDSRGHWEGDTLVVDTTNFSPKSEFRGSADGLHIVERFSRVGPNTLKYEVTYEDPTTWTRPWTVVVNMMSTKDKMYEYACHEGNDGLVGILSGARAQEANAAAGAAKTTP